MAFNRPPHRSKRSRWILRSWRRSCLFVILGLLLSGCESGKGGLPRAQREEHLRVLEQESRLSEIPVGAKPVRAIRRILCKDMDSDKSLAVGRDYEFSGLRSEVLEFHGSALTRAGWVLSQPAILENELGAALQE